MFPFKKDEFNKNPLLSIKESKSIGKQKREREREREYQSILKKVFYFKERIFLIKKSLKKSLKASIIYSWHLKMSFDAMVHYCLLVTK